jgi:hypothetical protein
MSPPPSPRSRSCKCAAVPGPTSDCVLGLLAQSLTATPPTLRTSALFLVQTDGLMPDFYRRASYPDPTPFPFKDTVPAGVLVYLGTNDYNKGENPSLDAAFTAGLLQFMSNVTKLWYGTPQAPAKVGVRVCVGGGGSRGM